MTISTNSPETRSLLSVFVIALAYFTVHLLTSTRYGYFRDALYYLACSEHLAAGYVDQPPLIAVLGWIARHTLGTSLPALLFWPALAGALRIILTAVFARELGAGRFGTVLAAALAATPGVWWVVDHQFAMNGLEPLFWGGMAYVVLRLINSESKTLARVWSDRGYRTAEQVLNRDLCRCVTCRTFVNTPAQNSLYFVDPAGRRNCTSDLLTKPDLEYSAPLAVSRADAKHSRDR